MNKQTLLRVINPVMALDFICLIGTALADDAIPRDVYGVVHPVFGYIFLACVVVHVFLNWTWIKTNFFPSKK